LNAQQRKQPIKAGVEITVDAVKDCGQNVGFGHRITIAH
jgi:hypothetical protein